MSVKVPRTCRICGCSDRKACPGGCHWVGPDLCSACVPNAVAYLVIPSLPTSTNMLERMHWAVKGRMRKAFAQEIIIAAANAGLKLRPTDTKPGRRRVTITTYRPRRLDPDNTQGGLKPLLDAMRDVGLLRNDSPRWLELPPVNQIIEKFDCRTEILVEELP